MPPLIVGAEGDQRWSDHVYVEAEWLGRRHQIELFTEGRLLYSVPVMAAPFQWPCRRCSASVLKDTHPADEIFTRSPSSQPYFAMNVARS
jgi:hypothetical protein